MKSLQGKTALVIGASSGVGKATARGLAAAGVRVVGVARNGDGLGTLQTELPEGCQTIRADAAEPSIAEKLLREIRPELLVLASGVRPRMGAVDELSWESFSEPWNNDVKTAFHFMKAAVTVPLAPGSAVVVVSSGAAINGSPLSGGYAGAKRMQWLLAGYLQQLSDTKALGIRFVAALPKQLIEGTDIASAASAAYGARLGISGADYMKRFDTPLDAGKVAEAILGVLRGDVAPGVTAIGVTGKGIEPLT
jgi:NAD(P)-dependent dehydrogenase (short-subunit alcohol dehydrogenase family)